MDVQALRNDTPGCAHRVHLNNAGSSLMPASVLDAIHGHIALEGRIGGYEAAAEAEAKIGEAYGDLAALLGTPKERIAFTEHATASFVAALSSIPFERGDVLLTTRNDYVSNQIQYLALARRFGVEIVRAPDATEGGVDLQAMEELIRARAPKLVAVTHIPTSSGLVQDVTAIGAMCRAREILYLVDACQSVGQMPVDPGAIGCDFLAGTARKFLRGPRGAGFLWVSKGALERGLEPLFPDMRGADWSAEDRYRPSPTARRFESWEFAWALVIATGVAARYARAIGIEAIRERAWALAARLRGRLSELDGVRLLDHGRELASIVTVAVSRHSPGELMAELRRRGINTTAQELGDARIDYASKGSDGSLRFSPHYFNTEEEVDQAADALGEIIRSRP